MWKMWWKCAVYDCFVYSFEIRCWCLCSGSLGRMHTSWCLCFHFICVFFFLLSQAYKLFYSIKKWPYKQVNGNLVSKCSTRKGRKSCNTGGLTEAAAEVDVSRKANKMTHLKERNEITAEFNKGKAINKRMFTHKYRQECMQQRSLLTSRCVFFYNSYIYSYMKPPSMGEREAKWVWWSHGGWRRSQKCLSSALLYLWTELLHNTGSSSTGLSCPHVVSQLLQPGRGGRTRRHRPALLVVWS